MPVKRWKGYGLERLYVTNDAGRELGYWDVAAGRAHPSTAEVLPELLAIVGQFHPELTRPDTRPMGLSAIDLPPTQESVDRPKTLAPPSGPPVIRDLINNRAGEQLGARVAEAQAEGERATLWRRLLLGSKAYSSWELGVQGEELVSAELRSLCKVDRRWGFIQSIEVGRQGADIDFVAVGPAGIFTINAKHHRGSNIWVAGDNFLVNGQRHPYVRNSRHEAQRAERLLARALGCVVRVSAMVVTVNTRSLTIREAPRDVHVTTQRRLADYLRSQPQVLTPRDVAQIFEVARRSTTWT